MEKQVYYLFEEPTKFGTIQFILVFFTISVSNIIYLQISDKLQILILGFSFLVAFSLVSYDQTKIFGFRFRLIGLLTSILGLLLIYSPILLFFYDNTNIVLWLLLIAFGAILVVISVISDYYLIGIPEIVRAINYLFDLIKKAPEIVQKTVILILNHIYLLIPLLGLTIFIVLGLNKETSFVIVLSTIIFIAGTIRGFLHYKPGIETRIRARSNQAMYRISNVKWKIDSSINRYQCLSCNKPIKLMETTCTNCNNKITTCLICKLPFKEETDRSSCEVCKYQFHKKHWDFWIDFRGSCPNCKTNYKSVDSR